MEYKKVYAVNTYLLVICGLTIITRCVGSINTTISGQNRGKNLIRSKHANIRIKVDQDVYHLDRLQLACKSDYFEKLFTEDFRDKNVDFLELSVMDSDTFSTIVDIIYGKKFNAALNEDNYVFLLMAMDYLQMKFEFYAYDEFIKNFIQKKPFLDAKMFKLCEYVTKNRHFVDLLPRIYACLSAHLAEIPNHEEFPSLPLNSVVGIISGQRLGLRDVEDVFKCSRICVEWIFHDVENRLPHAVKLVNAARCRFTFPYQINDEDLSVKMRNAGEEITPDNVLNNFIKMVFHQGEIGVNNVGKYSRPEESILDYNFGIDTKFIQNEGDKLGRFLEKGDFHDIAIKVEGKLYKLHRCKLLSASGYFAHIFSNQSTNTSDQKNNDEEYLLDIEGVTQATFDATIRYIYHSKIDLNSSVIIGVLKTASVLKIDSLLGVCGSWIMRNIEKIQLETVVEILNFIRQNEKVRFVFLYKYLLCERITKAWSEGKVYDLSPFLATSIDILEELLALSALHVGEYFSSSPLLPRDLGISARKLLDICSLWVMDDVQNRYKFIPRIALAINCNRMLHYNDYKMESDPDLSNCSQQRVKDEIVKVLSSTSLIPLNELEKKTVVEFKQEPIFVASSRTTIRILNAEMDVIVSLWLYNDDRGSDELNNIDEDKFSYAISATTMGNTLFIAANVLDHIRNRIFFLAYNISSQKFTFLAGPQPPLSLMSGSRYKLLNCRGDIYCIFNNNGKVLKYLMDLNRWTLFAGGESKTDKVNMRFASDGKTLYRLYEISVDKGGWIFSTNKFFESYDFDGNSWVSVPELASAANELPSRGRPLNFMIMNGSDIAVLFEETLYVFDRNSLQWKQIPLPSKCGRILDKSPITQCESGLLYMNEETLYEYQVSDSNQNWLVKKKVDLFSITGYFGLGALEEVHRFGFRINDNDVKL